MSIILRFTRKQGRQLILVRNTQLWVPFSYIIKQKAIGVLDRLIHIRQSKINIKCYYARLGVRRNASQNDTPAIMRLACSSCISMNMALKQTGTIISNDRTHLFLLLLDVEISKLHNKPEKTTLPCIQSCHRRAHACNHAGSASSGTSWSGTTDQKGASLLPSGISWPSGWTQ